jgi:hypothetical protein
VSVFLLTNLAPNPPKLQSFDHFLELWVYAKQFVFGWLFIIIFLLKKEKKKKKKKQKERR